MCLDTSAVGRVLLGESDAAAVIEALSGFELQTASRLLALELRRLALRHGLVDEANRLIDMISLVPIDQALLEEAERIAPSSVATLGAIHLATAVALRRAGFVETLMTYDLELAAGAKSHGLEVIAPG